MEFQRVPLKFHPAYLTHTLKDTTFMQHSPAVAITTAWWSESIKSCSNIIVQIIRLYQNGHQCADDIYEYISLNENQFILSKISLNFFLLAPTDNNSLVVKVKPWYLTGDNVLPGSLQYYFSKVNIIIRTHLTHLHQHQLLWWRYE